jgi:SAM-dependent methyltransferase
MNEETNDETPLAETIASYDHRASKFATRWGATRLDRALNAFAARVTGQRLVLDLGCGPGRDIDGLTQLGCQVVGLDLSVAMLYEARRRVPAAAVLQADLRYPPLATASLDGVWACASLLHLQRGELPIALAEMARVLRAPGGVAYLALKGGHGEQWLEDADGHRTFFTYYQSVEIETALHHAGFQILESWEAADQAGRDRPWLNFVARHGRDEAFPAVSWR